MVHYFRQRHRQQHLTVNNYVDCTFNGKLVDTTGSTTGKLSLVKGGPNTLVLTGGNNTYTGGTIVNGGVLQIGRHEQSTSGVLPGNVTNSPRWPSTSPQAAP